MFPFIVINIKYTKKKKNNRNSNSEQTASILYSNWETVQALNTENGETIYYRIFWMSKNWIIHTHTKVEKKIAYTITQNTGVYCYVFNFDKNLSSFSLLFLYEPKKKKKQAAAVTGLSQVFLNDKMRVRYKLLHLFLLGTFCLFGGFVKCEKLIIYNILHRET